MPATGRTFYPWARVDLHVRFDNFEAEPVAAFAQRGFVRLETQPQPPRRGPTQGGQTRELQSVRAMALNSSDVADDLVTVAGILPIDINFEENGFRTANTATVRFLWKDAPFFSLFVRSALLDVYIGAASPDEFAIGQTDPLGPSYLRAQTAEHRRKHIRFRGWVDTWTDKHGDGGDWVELTARDYTALLLDAKVPPGTLIPMRGDASIPGVSGSPRRLDNIIRGILYSQATARDMPVRVVGFDPAQLPTLTAARIKRLAGGTTAKASNEAKRAAGGVDLTAAQEGAQAEDPSALGSEVPEETSEPDRVKRVPFEGATYWDVITDLCIASGIIPIVNLDSLDLSPPRVLLDSDGRALAAGAPVPFEVVDVGGAARRTRRMIYGENVASVTFSRKYGKVTAPYVECVSFDATARNPADRVVRERYPKTQVITRRSPGAEDGSVEVRTVPMPAGITDRAILARMAEAIHEMLGRPEMTAVIETNDLCSYVPDGAELRVDGVAANPQTAADLLDLRSGDSIELLIHPADSNVEARRYSDLQAWFVQGGVEGNVARLVAAGFHEAAARRVAALVQRGLPTKFSVRAARTQLSATDGISLSIEAVNYVEIRASAARVDRGRAAVPATTPTQPVSPSGQNPVPLSAAEQGRAAAIDVFGRIFGGTVLP